MGSVQKLLLGIGIMLAAILFFLCQMSGSPVYLVAILLGAGFMIAGLKNDSGHWPWDDKE